MAIRSFLSVPAIMLLPTSNPIADAPVTATADPDLDDVALQLLRDLQTNEHVVRHCHLCRLFCSGEFRKLGSRRLRAIADAYGSRIWLAREVKDVLEALADLAAFRTLGAAGAASATHHRERTDAGLVFGLAEDVLESAVAACLQQHFTGPRFVRGRPTCGR